MPSESGLFAVSSEYTKTARRLFGSLVVRDPAGVGRPGDVAVQLIGVVLIHLHGLDAATSTYQTLSWLSVYTIFLLSGDHSGLK